MHIRLILDIYNITFFNLTIFFILPLSQALWLSCRFAWIWSFPAQSQHSALCSFWRARQSWWLPRRPQTLLDLNNWEDEGVAWHTVPSKKWKWCYCTCQSYLIFLNFLLQTSNLEVFVTDKFEKTTVDILQLPHLVQQILDLPTTEFWQKLNGAKAFVILQINWFFQLCHISSWTFSTLTYCLKDLPAHLSRLEARCPWQLPSFPCSFHASSAQAVSLPFGPEVENCPGHHLSPWPTVKTTTLCCCKWEWQGVKVEATTFLWNWVWERSSGESLHLMRPARRAIPEDRWIY